MKNHLKLFVAGAMITTTIGLAHAVSCDIPNGGLIQNAITNDTCDTINVDASYVGNEQLHITRPVILLGNGATLDYTNAQATAISIEASDVTVDGFKIQNLKGYGISTKNTAGSAGLTNLTITNNTLTNIDSIIINRYPQYPSGVGIYVGYMSGYFTYTNGDLSNSNLVDGLNYAGLNIAGNTISNVSDGISIQGIVGSANITNNTITNTRTDRNGAGIWIDSSSDITVDTNNVAGAYYGLNITSYTDNLPWKQWNLSGSNNITVTNNTFTTQKGTDRYDGAGIAIYGSDLSTITIENNNLQNNANYGILAAFVGDYTYTVTNNNYLGNAQAGAVVAKSYISSAWVDQNPTGKIVTKSATINHTITAQAATADNSITFDYSLIENMGQGVWTTGSLTLSGTTDVSAAVPGTGNANGFEGTYTFDGVDVGSYDYTFSYETSAGTGVLTGSFEVALVGFGCITNEFIEPAVYFNTNSGNITMIDTIDIYPTPRGRSYATFLTPGTRYTFNFELLGSGLPQIYNVQRNAPSCVGY